MNELKRRALQVARRALKGTAALLLHHSGARELLCGVQRAAVGGRRVLIVSYHRVVADFELEARRGLPSLNISRSTFRKQIEVIAESHDIVRLDEALEILDGKREVSRDVAVITLDDGYRDVYDHAYPVLREMRLPAIVYVPSNFVGTERRLLHDRLWTALLRMEERKLGPISVGVGGRHERVLTAAFEGGAGTFEILERLIAENPTPVLYGLADALEERLGLSGAAAPRGQLPMSWDMLREMAEHGFESGAHTAEHTVLTNQPLDEARREIAQCKSVIEANTGRPVRHFAYCNGWYSAGIAQALKAEGFVSGATTEDLPNVPGVDPFALKRRVVWEMSSAGVFGGWSEAVAACQFCDSFGVLSLQKPVLGARPTFFGSGALPTAEQKEAAHG